MKILISTIIIFFLAGCYQTPEIGGFDQQKWNSSLQECNDYRTYFSQDLVKNKKALLSKNQNE